MRRATRASTVAIVGGALAGMLGAAASCTTFNGVSLPAHTDASTLVDSSTSDGPVGDTAPAPDGPVAQTYLSLADAARLCTRVFACPYLSSSIESSNAVLVDPTNYSLCMHWLAGPLPSDRLGIELQQQVFQCMAGATSCQQAGECLSYEQLAPNDPRCADAGGDGGGAPRCTDDGGTILGCDQLYAIHCGSSYYAPGSRCLVGADQSLGCALGKNCSITTSCIGSSLFDECGTGSNLHFQLNCPYSGYDCNTTPDGGWLGCLTGTDLLSCSGLGTRCAGTTVQVCDGYDLSTFDCKALGGTCSAAGGSAICTTPSDACTPFDPGINACTGSTIALCVGGQKQSFDCASIGLTCIAGSGASGHCG